MLNFQHFQFSWRVKYLSFVDLLGCCFWSKRNLLIQWKWVNTGPNQRHTFRIFDCEFLFTYFRFDLVTIVIMVRRLLVLSPSIPSIRCDCDKTLHELRNQIFLFTIYCGRIDTCVHALFKNHFIFLGGCDEFCPHFNSAMFCVVWCERARANSFYKERKKKHSEYETLSFVFEFFISECA